MTASFNIATWANKQLKKISPSWRGEPIEKYWDDSKGNAVFFGPGENIRYFVLEDFPDDIHLMKDGDDKISYFLKGMGNAGMFVPEDVMFEMFRKQLFISNGKEMIIYIHEDYLY